MPHPALLPLGSDVQFWRATVQPQMSKEQWDKNGRPFHVLAADVQVSNNARAGVEFERLFYRTWIPAYKRANVVVGTTKGTTAVRSGLLLPKSPELTPLALTPCIVGDMPDDVQGVEQATDGTPVLLWDWGMPEAKAQMFDTEAK